MNELILTEIQEHTAYQMPKFNVCDDPLFMFLDVETNGLPEDFNAHPSQINYFPHIVQLAFVIADLGQTYVEYETLIKPNGWDVGESVKVHGKTQKMCMEQGIDITEAIEKVNEEIKETHLADRSLILVCHNIAFDYKMLAAECFRNKIDQVAIYFDGGYCTMKGLTEYVGITNWYGYKWPKLQELHYMVFGNYFEDAHDALADVKATMNCLFQLIRDGNVHLPDAFLHLMPEPQKTEARFDDEPDDDLPF